MPENSSFIGILARAQRFSYILNIHNKGIIMRKFAAGDLTGKTGDLFEAATLAPVAITKHRKPRFVMMSMERYRALIAGSNHQVSIDVADMPDELGRLWDQGVEDQFGGR